MHRHGGRACVCGAAHTRAPCIGPATLAEGSGFRDPTCLRDKGPGPKGPRICIDRDARPDDRASLIANAD
ncbi:unnamed protein product, partial [Iphiclides podalirius]